MSNRIFKLTSAQLDYKFEEVRGKSLEDILHTHSNDICIILRGSGHDHAIDKKSHYEAALWYKGITMMINGELNNESANQTMIKGLTECVKHINRPMRVCVIVATQLGFEKAFKGSGINCALIEDFYEELYSRGCTFTQCLYMADAIKTFLRNANHTTLLS